MVADGPTGREISDTVRLSSKVSTSISSFQLRWGSSIIESWRGGGWGRGRLKCEDVDCICVSFQRSLPKKWWKYEKFKKTLIHREVRTVTSIFYVNGCAEISGNTASIHNTRSISWYLRTTIDTYFTAAWGFLLIPYFFARISQVENPCA